MITCFLPNVSSPDLFVAVAVTRAATKMSVCPLNADENDDKKSKDSRLN
jgi:hypothetical protein